MFSESTRNKKIMLNRFAKNHKQEIYNKFVENRIFELFKSKCPKISTS